jgi:predicted  nucleic acid-binding Zn-ribbon protein
LNAPGKPAAQWTYFVSAATKIPSQERIASIPNRKLKKEQVASMTLEQEHQLENLDIEIQIAEKQLRVASIRKEIAQVELDCGILQRDLREQLRGSLV